MTALNTRLCFIAGAILFFCAFHANQVEAVWPPAVGPFVDKCYGKQQQFCNKECTWSTKLYPWCFNAEYLALSPSETIDVTDNIGLALKFFSFSYGLHLAEGTMKKDYYNVLVDECAKLCLESALHDGNRRCLSFDFYPFEDPWYAEPWLESIQAGVCSLNTGNPDTGRVRNEDQGLTDAELFYQSHFTRRPVSQDSGLYVLRDARGDSIGNLLDYGAGGEGEDLRTINLWGKSRWGIFHFNLNTASLNFSGGFTPVDLSQRCPGMLTKQDTLTLCQTAGGRLCTAAEIQGLKGRKLGCSLDEFSVWAAEDAAKGMKFARCCADYVMPVDCDAYMQNSRIAFCAAQTWVYDCTAKASGTTQQTNYGFGHLLDNFRQRCASGEFGSSCQGAMMRPWYYRERCLWCPTLGGSDNNAGECRPGGDFGVCEQAPLASKVMFGYNLWKVCGKATACYLKAAYPDVPLPGSCN